MFHAGSLRVADLVAGGHSPGQNEHRPLGSQWAAAEMGKFTMLVLDGVLDGVLDVSGCQDSLVYSKVLTQERMDLGLKIWYTMAYWYKLPKTGCLNGMISEASCRN